MLVWFFRWELGKDLDEDLRWLVSWVVDGVAKSCIAVEDSGLEELFEAVGEGFGAAC